MKDENVICVERKVLEEAFDMTKQYWEVTLPVVERLPFVYLNRCFAENDYEHKQIIPYAVVMDQYGNILCYQRHGSERRLADCFSVGIGGHVNDRDEGNSLSECLLNGLRREFYEETGLGLSHDRFRALGMINEELTEVGHCHLGVVFLVSVTNERLVFDAEIGKPQWKTIKDLDLSSFELWSALALRLVSNVSVKK